MYYPWGCRGGGDVIGVFDRTKLNDLTLMIRAASDAVRDPSRGEDD